MKETINDRAYVVYDENDTEKFNFIDSHFANLAKQMGAVEYQIPALIDGDILKKSIGRSCIKDCANLHGLIRFMRL